MKITTEAEAQMDFIDGPGDEQDALEDLLRFVLKTERLTEPAQQPWISTSTAA